MEKTKRISKKASKITKVEEKKKRPTTVAILGWISIGYAIFITVSSMIAFIYLGFARNLLARSLYQYPAQMRSLLVLFNYSQRMMLPTMAIAIFVIIAGIFFLKLHAWARDALEVVSWLTIGYRIGTGIFFMVFWRNVLAHMPFPQAGPGLGLIMGPHGTFMTLISTAMHVVPLAVIIYVLRSKDVTEAFAKS
jgi:hypothetical protein